MNTKTEFELSRAQVAEVYNALEAVANFQISDLDTSIDVGMNLLDLKPQIETQTAALKIKMDALAVKVMVKDEQGSMVEALKIVTLENREKADKIQKDFDAKVMKFQLRALDYKKLLLPPAEGSTEPTPMPPAIYRFLKPILNFDSTESKTPK